MKAFAIADIHGYFTLMMRALKRAGFDEADNNHIIISCGDLLDRGHDARKCLQFVNKMHEQNRAILIKGNHEDLLEELLVGRPPGAHDWHNGTIDTIRQLYTGEGRAGSQIKYHLQDVINNVKLDKDLQTYLSNLQWYYEAKNYVFVHGWLPLKYKKDSYSLEVETNLKIVEDREWKNAIWNNGMSHWERGWRFPNKTVVCGHYHTSWGHTHLHNVGVEFPENRFTTFEGNTSDHLMHTEIFEDDGIIAMDACTALSKKVNVLVIDNFE